MAEDFADSIAEQVDSLEVGQLVELCTQFTIPVPDAKKEKLGAVKRLLMKYVDEQLGADNEVLGNIDGAIGKILKSRSAKKDAKSSCSSSTVAVKNEDSDDDRGDVNGGAAKSGKSGTSTTKLPTDFLRGVKLREFKIDGVVGRGSGCIDWQNLQFQIKKGKTAGHSREEIMNGVIKAMKVGTSLHRYYQNNVDDMSWDDFFNMLESHYICKTLESSKVFTSMDTSSQEPDEEAGDFAFRMLEMAKRVIKLGEKEEYSSWDPTFVRQKCLQAMSVGLNDSTIRADLREFLKDHTKSDSQIIDEVAKSEKRLNDLKKKMKGKNGASTNALYSNYSGDGGDNKNGNETNRNWSKPAAAAVADDPVLAAVHKLSEKVDDIGKMATRVDALEVGLASVQQQLVGMANGQLPPQQQPPVIPAVGGRRYIKCKNCEANQIRFCRHCSKCGEEGHKRRNCPN